MPGFLFWSVGIVAGLIALAGWVGRIGRSREAESGWPLGLKIAATVCSGVLLAIAGCAMNGPNGFNAILVQGGAAVLVGGILWWFLAGLMFFFRRTLGKEDEG